MRAFVAGAASWDTVIHLDEPPTSSGTVFVRTAYEGVGSTGAGKALNLARLDHHRATASGHCARVSGGRAASRFR